MFSHRNLELNSTGTFIHTALSKCLYRIVNYKNTYHEYLYISALHIISNINFIKD